MSTPLKLTALSKVTESDHVQDLEDIFRSSSPTNDALKTLASVVFPLAHQVYSTNNKTTLWPGGGGSSGVLDSECKEALWAPVSSREQAPLFTPTSILNCLNYVFSTITRHSDKPIAEIDQVLVLLRPFHRRGISLREPSYRQADPIPILPGSVYLPS
ncbi:hypothetical protein L211DRAFT_854402 [Terfezia boudieri ATCC MYA-4762]|uniref:Uncharacterized protein n=1 Tax=Terfezia boudieri ATCC MYA-4762 TaxID=1051890 RepID=A0A3N4LJQ5_9PEZI|nr:hypothetical protein L211DRAFT_854402 [Terfezia boudieri ATCC MYA-4762]